MSRTNEFLFADATFKTAPVAPFTQCLNVLLDFDGVAIPVCHVAMSSRHASLYMAIFDKLKEILPELNPRFIMTDFELRLAHIHYHQQKTKATL